MHIIPHRRITPRHCIHHCTHAAAADAGHHTTPGPSVSAAFTCFGAKSSRLCLLHPAPTLGPGSGLRSTMAFGCGVRPSYLARWCDGRQHSTQRSATDARPQTRCTHTTDRDHQSKHISVKKSHRGQLRRPERRARSAADIPFGNFYLTEPVGSFALLASPPHTTARRSPCVLIMMIIEYAARTSPHLHDTQLQHTSTS
jgi:hypothetical protein